MNTTEFNRLIRRISTALLLLTVVSLFVSIMLMESGFGAFNVMELHQALGLLFFLLVLVHMVLSRKKIKDLFSTNAE